VVSLSRGLCWFIPEVALEIPYATYLLTCSSTSPKQRAGVWLCRNPSVFSV
jgi:hypothetical protein